MRGPALPRSFRHLFQPLFWRDKGGHVVAWENNAEGNPDVSASPRCQRVPATVEQAAWADDRGALIVPGGRLLFYNSRYELL